MRERHLDNRLLQYLLMFLMIITTAGTLMVCSQPVKGPAAAISDVQKGAVPGEPMLAVATGETAHDADPDAGLSAVQTMQSRLLTINKRNEEKQEMLVCITALLVCGIVARSLYMQSRTCFDLSCLILRRRAAIIYILSQDGMKS